MKTNKQVTTFLLAIVFNCVITICHAQSYETNINQKKPDFYWPEGKKMALSLSFDDARISQVDNGIPLLDKYGVKATFYVSINSMSKKLEAWKKAVNNGHDIGNHTLIHSCTVNYDFINRGSLEEYTLSRMKLELDSSNEVIKRMLGIRPVSFAYPCGQTFIGRGINTKSYVPIISVMFESGRGWLNENSNNPVFCDMAQLMGMELDGKSFDQVKKLIDAAKSKGKWLILAGHEINEGGNQTSMLSTIEAICKYASDPANGIWIDNVHNIASYVKEKEEKSKRQVAPVAKKYVHMAQRSENSWEIHFR